MESSEAVSGYGFQQPPPVISNADPNEMMEESQGELAENQSNKPDLTNASANPVDFNSVGEYITPDDPLAAEEEPEETENFEEPGKPHQCTMCPKSFKTATMLQNHTNSHVGNKPHGCPTCPSKFTTSGELARHTRYRHTHEKPHKCTECDYASVELSKLKRHMRSHTGERPYKCPNCDYAALDDFKLQRHMRTHTKEKPYPCDVCFERFSQSNSLKAHKLTHSLNRPVYQCHLCPTTCNRQTDLRSHVAKLHATGEPQICNKCKATFPDRYSLKEHAKTHKGQKCFKCDRCDFASVTQRSLNSHVLIHDDLKPYKCDHCDQSFRQKQLLHRHVKLRHTADYEAPTPGEKNYECPVCNKMFRHQGNLTRHSLMHCEDGETKEDEASQDLMMDVEQVV